MRDGMPRAMRFSTPSRGAVRSRLHELDQDRRQTEPQRPPHVVLGQRHDQLAQAEQLEQHVRVKARDLAAGPGRHLGTPPLARALARLLGDGRGRGREPLAARLTEQRRAHARDRDAERAGVDAERATPEAHRLDQHGPAAAERVDDGVARGAERRHRAARHRRVHAARVAVKPVRERALERRLDVVQTRRGCAPPRPRRPARPARPASRTRAAGAAAPATIPPA